MKKKGTSPMDAALSYLTAKPRTVREMELYLDGKEYGEYEVYQVIERLKELNYLNDEKYAQDFVASRLATKPVSRRKLKEQLYAHKLPAEAIDIALSTVSGEMEAQNAAMTADKYWRQFMALPDDERARRVIKRLVARGYDFDTIRASIKELTQEDVEIDMTEAEDDEE